MSLRLHRTILNSPTRTKPFNGNFPLVVWGPCKKSFSPRICFNTIRHSHQLKAPTKITCAGRKSKYDSFSIKFSSRNHPLHVNLGAISHLTSQNGRRPPQKIPLKSRVGLIASAGATLFALGGKGKYLLGALKLTKFASLSSMLVTVGTYSMFFGWPYACGMVGLILVHESGHALAMMRLGIPFSPMIFVPFVGAGVAMNRAPRDAFEEALVALGGPVLGSMGAGIVGIGGYMTDSQLLFALADFGFMINLFNMLPLGFLDGGRICGAISPYSGLVGLGVGSGLIYYDLVTNPIFYLIMMGGAYQTFSRLYYKNNVPLNYYSISSGKKIVLTGSYFGLISALVAAMAANNTVKKNPRQLQQERTYRYVDY